MKKVQIAFFVHRKGRYFIFNVAVPMIFTLMVSAYMTDAEGAQLEAGGKLSIAVTTLLTAVAYKYVVQSTLSQFGAG